MENLNHQFKILVVDDVVHNYTYLMTVLKKLNCSVVYAVNGKEAIDICKKDDDIDMIFMDLNLPIINGFEATRTIKELRNNLPIIAVTAYSSGENRKKAKKAGCDDYMVKPVFKIQIENLLDKYKKVFINKSNVSSEIGAIKYL